MKFKVGDKLKCLINGTSLINANFTPRKGELYILSKYDEEFGNYMSILDMRGIESTTVWSEELFEVYEEKIEVGDLVKCVDSFTYGMAKLDLNEIYMVCFTYANNIRVVGIEATLSLRNFKLFKKSIDIATPGFNQYPWYQKVLKDINPSCYVGKSASKNPSMMSSRPVPIVSETMTRTVQTFPFNVFIEGMLDKFIKQPKPDLGELKKEKMCLVEIAESSGIKSLAENTIPSEELSIGMKVVIKTERENKSGLVMNSFEINSSSLDDIAKMYGATLPLKKVILTYKD